MRTTLAIILAASTIFLSPASAADADVKQEVAKIASAFAEGFNKQDGAGIAALFAKGGVLVNPTGPHMDIEQFYQGAFKAGFNHSEIAVDNVSSLGPDLAISMGEYRNSGKSENGSPLEAAGRWTAVDVREGGAWKVRLLTAFPKGTSPMAAPSSGAPK